MLDTEDYDDSGTKRAYALTPPSSPDSVSSFSYQQNGNKVNHRLSMSPRHLSNGSETNIDGHFGFLEEYSNTDADVFTISKPGQRPSSPDADTLSKKSRKSQTGSLPQATRHDFTEDKYKWTESDSKTGKKFKTTKSRKVCLIVMVIVLILCILAGVGVILAFKVFKVGEDTPEELPQIDTEYLILDGSLDLKETWVSELADPSSSLYKRTANNFTAEMDKLLENSEFNETYTKTEVTGFRKGSIQVFFKQYYNQKYKKRANSKSKFSELVVKELKRTAAQSDLSIDEDTIRLAVATTTTAAPTTTQMESTSESVVNTTSTASTTTSTVDSTSSAQTSETLPNVTSVTTPTTVPSSTSLSQSTTSVSSSSPRTSIETSTSEHTQSSSPLSTTSSKSSTTSTTSSSSTISSSTSDKPLNTTLPSSSATSTSDSSSSPITTTFKVSVETSTSEHTQSSSPLSTTSSTSSATTSSSTISLSTSDTPLNTTLPSSSTTSTVTPFVTSTSESSSSSSSSITRTPEQHSSTTAVLTSATSTTTTTPSPPLSTVSTTTSSVAPTSLPSSLSPSSKVQTTPPSSSSSTSSSTSSSSSTLPSSSSPSSSTEKIRGSSPLSSSSSSTTTKTTKSTTTSGLPETVQTTPSSSSASTASTAPVVSTTVSPSGTKSSTVSPSGTKSSTFPTSTQEPTTTTTARTTTTTVRTTTTIPPTTTAASLCQAVTFETCRNLGFTDTVFPNLFGHKTQRDAEKAFNLTARDATQQLCSDTALTYLCSIHFPKCSLKTGYMVFPCKSLCDEAVSMCGDYFANPFPCSYFQATGCVSMVTTTLAPVTTTPRPQCIPTEIADCRDLGFTQTFFPNDWGETNQSIAMVTFNQYLKPRLIDICPQDTLYLTCSVQFPMCAQGKVYKPCKRMCKAAVKGCPQAAPYFPCDSYPDIDCMAPSEPQLEAFRKYRRKCRSKEFSCKTVSKCIAAEKTCDGTNDCSDWSDEMDCTCNEYQFQCEMGMCIKSYQQCDGESQCPDNSDEKNCEHGCTRGQVKCPNGKCIMREWLCDGLAECDDGWDERNCSFCRRGQYTCPDKSCIDMRKMCDGRPDCPEGKDEWDCISVESGVLHLAHRRYKLPVCASTWSDMYGEYTCTQLLGEGSYIGAIETVYNVYTFLNITSVGPVRSQVNSVLGPMQITQSCPGQKAIKLECQPRGCGKRMVDNQLSYIVNGEPAATGAWPWHVALYFGGQYFCGGSLISRDFVLTAAHCVEKYLGDFSMMTVKLGANSREEKETTQHVVKVEAIKSHKGHEYFIRNDIALLQLANPVNLTNYVQPVCLPKPDETLPLHSTCYTVGWGKMKWDGDYAQVLQQLKMTLWDTQKCNSSDAWNGSVYDSFMCAGYYSGIRSICKSDSGGPLLCKDRQNTWKLRGINSYVGNYCNMTERPNVFSNITKFLPWIYERTECIFKCDNGKCLYKKGLVCDRVDDCGDNSDEIRECNRTLECNFDDKFLCGYEYNGWELGYDNKKTTATLRTKSNAPHFDHTVGRYPGYFFYGKLQSVLSAELVSPRFTTTGQTCVSFAYYLRGTINIGLSVQLYEYYKSGNFTVRTVWQSMRYAEGSDMWRTGYFNIINGDFKLKFTGGDLLKIAIDDVKKTNGMCQNVLCDASTEYRCRSSREHRCIPRQSQCNLVVDCDQAVDETLCTGSTQSYICTFENGNLCGLKQAVGDASDWWLVNASFVRNEIRSKTFVDHTSGQESGHMFYINGYGIQSSSHMLMTQQFYLDYNQYCLSFYYQLKADVTFSIHIECATCQSASHIAKSTFDYWTLFQVTLPKASRINVTYDVQGIDSVDSFIYSYIAMDDIFVKPGICPQYVCPENYTKCRTSDRCVPQSAICDRKVNCQDESDEETCTCTSDEFKCTSGRCISDSNKCDRIPQCLDGSDEGSVCDAQKSVSCTFDHPYMCGYEFINYTRYKWQRMNGATPTTYTGPVSDHTRGDSRGYYLYTEGNSGSNGDNATVRSPEFSSGVGQSLEFYYHLYTDQPTMAKPGILMFILENIQTGVRTVKWSSHLKLEDKWLRLCEDLPDNVRLRALFTAIRNETTGFGVDNAIDDVKLNNHKCDDTTTRPPVVTTTQGTTTEASKCRPDQWLCNDGYTCIDATWRCDGGSDCPDSSDELDCLR